MITTQQPTMRTATYASCLPPDCPSSLLEEFAENQVSISAARRRYTEWKRGATRRSRIAAMAEVRSDNGSAYATFEEAVASLMAEKGLSRREACRLIAKSHPDLHADFINRNQLPSRGDNP